jgi:hypothetical protein
MAVPARRPPSRRVRTSSGVSPGQLVASAARVDPKSSDYRHRRNLTWQKQCYLYSKLIPELNYASRFYAKMMSRLKVFPAFIKNTDDIEPIKTGPPVDILNRIQDPGGGRSQILFQFGRHMFIAGDGFLFGRNLNTENERWSFVNKDEIIIQDDQIIWKRYISTPTQIFTPDEAIVYRLWTPDPEWSGEAESPMRACLEIAEELDLLTKAVRATAVSRMPNGLLKVPSELSFGSDIAGLDDDPEENKFLADMIDHLAGVIENAGTAEAAAPFLAEGAFEYLRELAWEPLHDRQTDYMERDLRKEAIERLAMGLDLPPEVLKGFAQANHWGTRQIQIDTWRSHGSIIAAQFCDDLSEAYLRPALKDAGFDRWDEVVLAFDDSEVIITHDRSDDADKAFDRGQINSEGYRQMKSIPDDFAPADEDIRIFLATKLRLPALLKGTRFELAPNEMAQPGGNFPPGPEADTSRGPTAEDGPPLPGPAGVSRRESRSLAIEGAAHFALIRCRQVAGARICNQKKRIPEWDESVMRNLPGEGIAAYFGAERLKEAEIVDGQKLVKGGTEGLIDACMAYGIDEAQAKALAQTIEVFAGKTLFSKEIPSLPSALIAAISRACEVSDMLVEEDTVRQNNDSLEKLTNIVGSAESNAV